MGSRYLGLILGALLILAGISFLFIARGTLGIVGGILLIAAGIILTASRIRRV